MGGLLAVPVLAAAFGPAGAGREGFAVPGKIGEAYTAEVHKFAEVNGIPVRRFVKGEKKEEIARPFIEAVAATGNSAVALIGIAQEKAPAWRPWPANIRVRLRFRPESVTQRNYRLPCREIRPATTSK